MRIITTDIVVVKLFRLTEHLWLRCPLVGIRTWINVRKFGYMFQFEFVTLSVVSEEECCVEIFLEYNWMWERHRAKDLSKF